MQKILLVGISILSAVAMAQTSPKKAANKKKTAAPTPPVEVIYGNDQTTTTPTTTTDSGAPLYQFNTDGTPGKTDDRGGINFKVPQTDAEKADKATADPVKHNDDEQGFKTYVGYPKNQIGAYYYPVNTTAKWTYLAQDFNFSSSSNTGFGVYYRFLATPQINAEVDYARYTVKAKSGSVTPFEIVESSADVDTLWARFNYFWVNDKNFFFRYGPGFEVGYDAYPILGFKDSTHLEMTTVKDLTFGVNFNLQVPIITKLLFQFKVGAATGSGAGNSGELTSKSNSSYYAAGAFDWNFNDHHGMTVGIDYRVRKAKIEGKVGANKDTWETTATNSSLKAGYNYTF